MSVCRGNVVNLQAATTLIQQGHVNKYFFLALNFFPILARQPVFDIRQFAIIKRKAVNTVWRWLAN